MAYGWSDATVSLMSNWGGIASAVCFLPVSFLMVRAGGRATMLLGGALVAAAAAGRAASVAPAPFLYCSHSAQFVNGVAGVIIQSMPPLISANWFPDGERICALAIAQVGIIKCASVYDILC